MKIKIVDLEGTVDNIGQINKAIRRELEVAKEAQKREGLFLKEEVGALGEKNKKLTAKIDEMVWNAREQALLRE